MTIFENEEDDMHSTFEQLMNKVLAEKYAAYLFHEVKIGKRRADFAAAYVDEDKAWERHVAYGNNEGVPDEYRRTYHTAMNKCPLPKSELVDRPYYRDDENDEQAERAVEWLIENNYLLEDSDGWYRFQRPRPVLDSVAVFELKIHKWEDGLRQAKGYRNSIGEVGYVVLDADRTRGATNNLDEFKRENIGLMAMDRDSIEVIYEPTSTRNRRPNEDARTRLSEWAFKEFAEEHGREIRERKAADDIGKYQNPFLAQKNAHVIDKTLERRH